MSQPAAAKLLLAAQQHLALRRYSQAIALLQQLLAESPGVFVAHSLLGISYHATGSLDAAIAHLRAAIEINSEWAEGYGVLGAALAGSGLHAQAADAFATLVKMRPQNVEALNNLGTVLRSLGRYDQSIVHLREAVRLRPDQAEIHHNLGNSLLESGQTTEALAELQQAVLLRPDFVQLYQGLGNALISLGRIPAAIDCFRRALTIDPSHHAIHSSLLMSMNYTDSADEIPQAIFEEHLAFGRRHTDPLPRPTFYSNDRDPNRRLRVGYVSSDFRRHSVSYFIEPIFAHHDPAEVEIFCYADVPNPDEVTDRLKKYVERWRDIAGQSDAQVADQIRADQIDILIDLVGHTGGGRLLLFGRKPAPVQVSYLGYPATTGVSAVDYRITDRIADPSGEKLLRIDPPFLCYQPSGEAPDVSSPPALKSGHITFGSFNALPKITPRTIALWSAVIKAVAGSRMMIKGRGLQLPELADRLAAQFLVHGIERSRLTFLGHETTTAAHLARYHAVDIALDAFPYNGTTTTCEALWMGVPVVTRCGQIHAARVGASILTAMGQQEWIANGDDEFVRIAEDLAGDSQKLSEHRAQLRGRMKSSPITDGPGFTRRFEFALRQMWVEYCG
jgi:protein O-GlcNAc transferase